MTIPEAPPSDLGHELRTPLHAIRNAAELVLSGDVGAVSAEAAALVTEIAAAARRLETVVEAVIGLHQGADCPVAGTGP